MQFEEIKLLIEKELPGSVLGEDLASTPKALLVDPAQIRNVCEFLHTYEKKIPQS